MSPPPPSPPPYPPCYGVKCPDRSSCTVVSGTATCVCTGQNTHFVGGRCITGPLAKSDWLDPHNNARAAVGLGSLSWNASLAASALDLAKFLVVNTACQISRSSGMGRNLGRAVTYGTSVSVTTAVNSWVAQGARWSYAVFNHQTASGCRTGNFDDCGCYTQVIWNATTSVGCAMVKDTSLDTTCFAGAETFVWVCSYDPPGNVDDEFPYVQDLCFRVSCPSPSTCDASSGYATCVCQPGLALVNSLCVPDPCRNVSCPFGQSCLSETGKPVCGCPRGKVPSTNFDTGVLSVPPCVVPRCQNVFCPDESLCRVNANNITVCSCPPGQSLVEDVCTDKPTKPVVVTSLTLFTRANFQGNSFIIRVPDNSAGCLALDRIAPNGLNVWSYQVAWDAQDAALAPGSTTEQCKEVLFYQSDDCSWPVGTTLRFFSVKPTGALPWFARPDSSKEPLLQRVSSVACTF